MNNAVVNTSTIKNYYRTCEKSFKERCNNQKSTKLSNYIRDLKKK